MFRICEANLESEAKRGHAEGHACSEFAKQIWNPKRSEDMPKGMLQVKEEGNQVLEQKKGGAV